LNPKVLFFLGRNLFSGDAPSKPLSLLPGARKDFQRGLQATQRQRGSERGGDIKLEELRGGGLFVLSEKAVAAHTLKGTLDAMQQINDGLGKPGRTLDGRAQTLLQ